MNYQVPQHIDNNKVFIVNRSEIERRLDPEPYHNERKDAINRIKRTSIYLPLSSVVNFKQSITRDIKPGDIFVGLENIISDTGEYVETTQRESISSALTFETGDILFPKLRPYLNKVFFATFDGLCSTEFHVLKSKSRGVNALYLFIFLSSSLVLNQTKHLMTGNTLPRLQTEDVRSLLIPIPSADIQKKIIDCYLDANNCKLQKENESKALIGRIDKYLLNELGIVLPEVSFGLQNRIFLTSSNKITGNRIDPLFALCWGKNAMSAIYENIKLHTIADICKGNALTREKVIPGSIPVIAGGQTSPYSHNVANFAGNVITVSSSGAYAGYVWYHRNPIYATDCSVISSKDESQFLTEYIFEVLKVQQRSIYWLQTGAAQPHVYASDLASLSIPDVPLSKQKEIVEHITSIRKQAKILQEEGKKKLEQAKKEVEQMILGS